MASEERVKAVEGGLMGTGPRGTQGDEADGWSAVGRQRARKTQGKGSAVRRELSQEAKYGAAEGIKGRRSREGGPTPKQTKHGAAGAVRRGQDAGDGRAVFEQLRKYVRTTAPAQYVLQTVFKLMKLAKERRFQTYLSLLPGRQREDIEEEVLRENWQDAIPYRLKQEYAGMESEWDAAEAEHQNRLALLLHRWIVTDRMGQLVIEERLRFFHFVNEDPEDTQYGGGGSGSYLDAVRPAGTASATMQGSQGEKERLRALCLQPAQATTKLRQRTADEAKALVMILNHEIEVDVVPPFLRLSMTTRELAVFEDIFMALEYTLHAHLEPGQKLYDNMPTSAVLALIAGGPEAATAHKQKIEEFKAESSRISLDMRTRQLKVTFKGRAAASKWEGWMLPFANRSLKLVDYEQIRERAKRTHELVRLDYYSFVVEVHKGMLSSRELLHFLTEAMGLQVQTLEHTILPAGGLQEKQWHVRVRAEGCPGVLSNKSYIVLRDQELVLHHYTINVNWPCRRAGRLSTPRGSARLRRPTRRRRGRSSRTLRKHHGRRHGERAKERGEQKTPIMP